VLVLVLVLVFVQAQVFTCAEGRAAAVPGPRVSLPALAWQGCGAAHPEPTGCCAPYRADTLLRRGAGPVRVARYRFRATKATSLHTSHGTTRRAARAKTPMMPGSTRGFAPSTLGLNGEVKRLA
jgi:hypothetical protein